MQLQIGDIYEGKVAGITKFGAFVELDEKTTGMVHISEVANTFVNEIKDHLKEGDTVVKVISIGETGKIALSIKALPAPAKKDFVKKDFVKKDADNTKKDNATTKPKFPPKKSNDFQKAPPTPYATTNTGTGSSAFEDMLNKFKQNSDEKMGDLKRNLDGKRKGYSKRSKA